MDVILKQFGKLQDPEEFKQEHGGVSHKDLGMELSTMAGVFGPVTGVLVEDPHLQPTVEFQTRLGTVLRTQHSGEQRQVRANQGHDVFQKQITQTMKEPGRTV